MGVLAGRLIGNKVYFPFKKSLFQTGGICSRIPAIFLLTSLPSALSGVVYFHVCIDVVKHCIELLLAALLRHTIKGGESRDSDIADSVSSSDISANFNLFLG